MNRTHARFFAASAGLLTALVSLPACQSGGGSSSAAPRRAGGDTRMLEDESGLVTVSKGIRINHSEWADLGYRWQWSSTPVYRGSGDIAFIHPIGDRVAVQSEDAWTCVVDAATGNTDWQVRNASALTSFVDDTRVGDYLLSCSRPEMFIMDVNSGNLLARQPMPVVVTTAPVIYEGHAVFGTPTGEVICHRFGTRSGAPLPPPLDDGIKAWGYLLDGTIVADPVRVGPLAGVVTEKGQVFFVDILTGSGRGTARISGGMDTNPVSDGTHMFVASRDQSIYAFAPDSDTYLWRERTADPLTDQPAFFDGVLYCTVEADGLVAFDFSQEAIDNARMGRRIWNSPDVHGEVIAVQNGDLIVWDGAAATRVDVDTGDVMARVELKGVRKLVAGTFEDGELYAVGTRGQLIKFESR
jgi:outer membrane protein assembly factor BamB